MVALGDGLVYKDRSTNEQIVLRPGAVRLVIVRSPTAAETWWINGSLVIHKVEAGGVLLEIGLPPADAARFCEVLGFPAA